VTLPVPPPGRHPAVRGLVAVVGVAAAPRHAMHECGDVVHVVDRPDGGACVIVADGQGHGRGARIIATMAVTMIAGLVGEGVREDAALVAANDRLLAHRGGQVSCEAVAVVIDPVDGVVRVSRFARSAAHFLGDDERAVTGGEAPPLGVYRGAAPASDVVPVSLSLACLVTSDGVRTAGGRVGRALDLASSLARAARLGGDRAAHAILGEAIGADDGRPRDDMAVACITFEPLDADLTFRRMSARVPLS
jgi:serine phosphatase RsbU (regulator of sigma subunit)